MIIKLAFTAIVSFGFGYIIGHKICKKKMGYLNNALMMSERLLKKINEKVDKV